MNIVYKIDNFDNFEIDQEYRIINFSDPSSFSYTFWKNNHKFPYWYSSQALDLLYISLAVFAADRIALRKNTPDGWSRNFSIYMPVIEYDLWMESKSSLEEMLNFLSGDTWTFIFRKRELSENEKNNYKKWSKYKDNRLKDYEQLCMFSGGLDSFIGTIDLLELTNKKTLFISHYGGGKGTKEFQDILKFNIIDYYNLEEQDFCQFYAKVVSGIEDTTRTRSFMFFSHAIAVATAFNKPLNLFIPENGFISLNIPATFSRIGTSSTRTTHPHYMKMFQALLDILNIPVTLINPYQFKTKGEMILECKNLCFLIDNLKNTMSCSHPDNGRMLGETEARHCGYCLPCVIRQAAIKKSGLTDYSIYRDRNFKFGCTSRTNLNSYLLGLEKFNPKYAFMTIQLNGPIINNIDKFTNLYIRGMKELKEYLEEFNE